MTMHCCHCLARNISRCQESLGFQFNRLRNAYSLVTKTQNLPSYSTSAACLQVITNNCLQTGQHRRSKTRYITGYHGYRRLISHTNWHENSAGKMFNKSHLEVEDEDLASDDWSLRRTSKEVGVTRSQQKKIFKRRPNQPSNPHILKIAVIGPPNAGKSTLSNQLIGWRFAAVSNKVHTTRTRAVGVLTEDNTQVVFLDTPGLTTPDKVRRHSLERSLLTDPYATMSEADLIVVVIDISKVWNRIRMDKDILAALNIHNDKRSILILNKVDLLKKKRVLLETTRLLTKGQIGGKPIATKETPDKEDIMTITFERMKSPLEDPSPDEQRTDSEEGSLVSVGPDDIQVATDSDEDWWKVYKKALQTSRKQMERENGWSKFDQVFMLSAKDGDGVTDLKRYLLESAVSGSWIYSSSMVTDQDPLEIARMCVWEKCLDHLPSEIPYLLKVKVDLWEIDENDMLRAVFNIICTRKRDMTHVLGHKGETLQKIAREAKQDLMNTFRRELTLKLVVQSKSKSKPL